MTACHTHFIRDDLAEIRTAAEDILAFTAGLDEAGFARLPDHDRRTFRALKNALAELAILVQGLPAELCARHSNVDWRGWIGVRDFAVHPRFSSELAYLEPAVVDELPALIAAVAKELTDGGWANEEAELKSAGP